MLKVRERTGKIRGTLSGRGALTHSHTHTHVWWNHRDKEQAQTHTRIGKYCQALYL